MSECCIYCGIFKEFVKFKLCIDELKNAGVEPAQFPELETLEHEFIEQKTPDVFIGKGDIYHVTEKKI